jgi:hypothetical protein
MSYSFEDIARNNPNWRVEASVFGIILLVLLAIFVPAVMDQLRLQILNASPAKAHKLAIASYAYAQDHGGYYPNGETSTVIYQKLFDGKYLSDPSSLFINSNGGRTYASSYPSVHLNAENVSFDFTTRSETGLTKDDPDDLPLLFSCVVEAPQYVSGANAASIDKTCPGGDFRLTIADLDQRCFLAHASQPGKVPVTNMEFRPAPGVTYLTKKP